jgi:hypothetical protein
MAITIIKPAMPIDPIVNPEVAHSDAHRPQLAAGHTPMSSRDFDLVTRSSERDH